MSLALTAALLMIRTGGSALRSRSAPRPRVRRAKPRSAARRRRRAPRAHRRPVPSATKSGLRAITSVGGMPAATMSSRICPSAVLFHTITGRRSFDSTAVMSSFKVNCRPKSPASAATARAGLDSFAPTAAGNAKPERAVARRVKPAARGIHRKGVIAEVGDLRHVGEHRRIGSAGCADGSQRALPAACFRIERALDLAANGRPPEPAAADAGPDARRQRLEQRRKTSSARRPRAAARRRSGRRACADRCRCESGGRAARASARSRSRSRPFRCRPRAPHPPRRPVSGRWRDAARCRDSPDARAAAIPCRPPW